MQDTVDGRVKRTQDLNAEVRRLPVGYDETVIEARAVAAELGKGRKVMFIQDTTLDEYWDIPLKIMQGYMTILVEAWSVGHFDDPSNTPTHVFLQVYLVHRIRKILLSVYLVKKINFFT